jgi:two-component system, LytTR family, response regulator
MMKDVLHKLSLTDKVFLCDGKECKFIELSDVRYFETYGSYTKTYYNGGSLLIYRTLNHLDARLSDKYFFRANRQHIVNISHIKNVEMLSMSSIRIEMSCGRKIDMSRRRSRLFKETLCL